MWIFLVARLQNYQVNIFDSIMVYYFLSLAIGMTYIYKITCGCSSTIYKSSIWGTSRDIITIYEITAGGATAPISEGERQIPTFIGTR